jgi:hypothetical protein
MTHAGWVANVDDGTPLNTTGLTEVQPPRYDETPAPENRHYATPRPEAWNPGCPNYPWWKLNLGVKPAPPVGERICESYLLAWIKELTRAHAADWLDLETSRAELEKQLVNLRKQSQVRG